MIRGVLVAALVLAVVTLARPVSAGYFDRIEVGARGLALASAYGAAVDDVSAIHWNPAALSLLNRYELLLTHGRPYAIGDLQANSVAVGSRLAGGGLALGWHGLGVTDVVGENLLSLAYGRLIWRHERRSVHAGATAKLAIVSFSAGASPERDFGSESKITGDLGVLLQEGPQWRFGAVLRHVGEPDFDFVEGGETTPMGGGVELSASYLWRPESAIHFTRAEIGGEAAYNYAGEIWFYDVFAIRAGVFDEEFAGGFGIRGDRWELDGGFLTHESLGNTYRVSLLFHLDEEAGR